MNKRYIIRVYDINGSFITSWDDATFDGFTKIVNGGVGQLDLRLARNRNNFGEGDDVKLGNKVEITIHDKETPAEGIIIYSGYISTYTPNLPDEHVGVTCLGYVAQLSDILYRDGNTMALTHNSTDPTDITADILTKFKARKTTSPVTWEKAASDSLNYTGVDVSYTYGLKYCNEAIDKTIMGFAPSGWYWYWPATNRFKMARLNYNYDHLLVIGQHITSMETPKTSDDLYNNYVFWNNKANTDPDYLFGEYTLSGSASSYGLKEFKETDGRVTQANTLKLMAESFLVTHGAPLITVRITVADSNGIGNKGYDIDSIEPGDTIAINDPEHYAQMTLWDVAKWDEDYWDFNIEYFLGMPMMVTKVDYKLDEASFELATRAPSIAKRITELNRKVDDLINQDSPTTF